MRWAPLATILLLAGCLGDGGGVARMGVDTYYVSSDQDLRHEWLDGSVHVVTCAGGKHVHLLLVRGAGDWPRPEGWMVHSGEVAAHAVDVDEGSAMLGIYACLAPGQVADRVTYQEDLQVLGSGRVSTPPTTV